MSFCANDCSFLLCRYRHQSKQNHKTQNLRVFLHYSGGRNDSSSNFTFNACSSREQLRCDTKMWLSSSAALCLSRFFPVSTPTFRIISPLSALHFYLFEGGLICNSLGHHLSFHLFQCSAWLVIDDKMELKDRPAGKMKTITLFAINKRWAVYSKVEIQYCFCVGWNKGV